MEFSAEVNKIFGQEMAKLFADKISEEEMIKEAEKAWKNISRRDNSYWSSSSNLETFVRQAVAEKLKEAISKILDQEEIQIDINKRAKEIIEETRKRTEEKIIETTSNTLAMIYSNQNGISLKNYIVNTIMECITR